MENASKALLIAGGVLLAVLILSVGIYTYVSIQNVSKSKAEVLKAEELSKFNMEFESFNKSSMYGTDIISVVNKAISYNEKYDNIINIELYVKNSFYTTKIYYELNSQGKYMQTGSETIEDNGLEGEKQYSLSNSMLIKFMSDKTQKKTEYNEDRTKCTEIKPGISEFKNSKFKCEAVNYNSDSGQVSYMRFEQI